MSEEGESHDRALETGLKKAIEWITEERRGNPQGNPPALVDEASRRFALSPLQGEYLTRHLLAAERHRKGS